MMSNKPKNDRYSVDEKHLAKELRKAGILPPLNIMREKLKELTTEQLFSPLHLEEHLTLWMEGYNRK